jgi:hypothetical protein
MLLGLQLEVKSDLTWNCVDREEYEIPKVTQERVLEANQCKTLWLYLFSDHVTVVASR